MTHVVTNPTPLFHSESGKLAVLQVPAAQDNLVWVLWCTETRECAIVDGPNVQGALDVIDEHQLNLVAVFNTHIHGDHIGVNRDLQKRGMLAGLRVVGSAKTADQIPGLTEPVHDGDEVCLGNATGKVMLTEGHLNGHISFLFEDLLFCGDTLFGGGCGYLFDGPAEKMHNSLQALSSLPKHTRVCCAHEYTVDNLRFARSIDPENVSVTKRLENAEKVSANGGSTVPSTISLERETNPFVRAMDEEIRRRVEAALKISVKAGAEQFAATRRLKDLKLYKKA